MGHGDHLMVKGVEEAPGVYQEITGWEEIIMNMDIMDSKPEVFLGHLPLHLKTMIQKIKEETENVRNAKKQIAKNTRKAVIVAEERESASNLEEKETANNVEEKETASNVEEKKTASNVEERKIWKIETKEKEMCFFVASLWKGVKDQNLFKL